MPSTSYAIRHCPASILISITYHGKYLSDKMGLVRFRDDLSDSGHFLQALNSLRF